MKISTLSIGDEVIFGEIVDTNVAHISSRLYEQGFQLHRHLCVGDNEPDIMDAIETLAAHNDFVIATGGLGPTADDLTARAAARATDRRLVLNEDALAHLRERYRIMGRELLPSTEKQALLPAKSTLVPNPIGTACGFIIPHKGCFLFFLPGVPGEMKRMLEETVIPFILARAKRTNHIETRVMRVLGLSESHIEERIKELARPREGLTIAYCVSYPEVEVKLRGEGDDESRIRELLDATADKVRERLGDHVVAEGGETIDTVVAALFRKKGITLSLAESCTGGLIAAKITDLAGSSAYFREGAVTYSNDAKIRLLQVPSDLLEKEGAVSSATAMAMARGIRKASGSDIALAVTGIAGPEGGTEDKPVGTVFIALAGRSECTAKKYQFNGSRERVRRMTAFTALDWLRRHLMAQPDVKVED
ncbi:MAG: competence/damage-inducible protein A [Geobacteraceae bacterium]|nr:competence/damage-inducible protein A [Geobacteraceae bacterium]